MSINNKVVFCCGDRKYRIIIIKMMLLNDTDLIKSKIS